jgi:hypothetical protein
VLLFGDASEVDLIKVHTQSGKLTLLRYENFDLSPLPRLRERIKVNLRRQVIEFFDAPSPDGQLCFPKSRYLSQSDPGRAELQSLERRLMDLGLAEEQYGCLASALQAVLDRHGFELDDVHIALQPHVPEEDGLPTGRKE